MKAPARDDVAIFSSAEEFRDWLVAQHATATELWVGYYKKGVAKASVTYLEAVDQALCFGWIDGIGYRIDDEVHANRFTPRKKRSPWSATNVARVQELKRQGRMHSAGLAAFAARSDNSGIYSSENRPADLPPAYGERLRANSAAWAYWQARPPGYRRTATWWVVSAKQEATRQRRLDQLIADCEAGRPIKPLSLRTERP